jgi:hypothetical protein
MVNNLIIQTQALIEMNILETHQPIVKLELCYKC